MDHRASTPQIPAVVGLLVDVSASMRASLRNETGGASSRLDGWAEALRKAAARAAGGDASETAGPPVRVFAYAVGVQKALARSATCCLCCAWSTNTTRTASRPTLRALR